MKVRKNKRYRNILKDKNKIKKYKKFLDDYYNLKKYELKKLEKSYRKRFKRLIRKLKNVYMICDYCCEPKPIIDFVYNEICLNEHCIECYLEDMQEYTGFPYLSDYKKQKITGC